MSPMYVVGLLRVLYAHVDMASSLDNPFPCHHYRHLCVRTHIHIRRILPTELQVALITAHEVVVSV